MLSATLLVVCTFSPGVGTMAPQIRFEASRLFVSLIVCHSPPCTRRSALLQPHLLRPTPYSRYIHSTQLDRSNKSHVLLSLPAYCSWTTWPSFGHDYSEGKQGGWLCLARAYGMLWYIKSTVWGPNYLAGTNDFGPWFDLVCDFAKANTLLILTPQVKYIDFFSKNGND